METRDQRSDEWWDREPDEVFSFTQDDDDYWYIPIDEGALIIEVDTHSTGGGVGN